MKRRMIILVSVALMATLGSVGCGSNTSTTPIVPPDTAPPAAVTGFGFQLNATQNPSVVLTWNPGAELDLAGYNVYRKQLLPATREMDHITAEMHLIGSVGSEIFADNNIMVGASYVYGVSAIDMTGNESARVESMPVKINIPVREGGGDLQLN